MLKKWEIAFLLLFLLALNAVYALAKEVYTTPLAKVQDVGTTEDAGDDSYQTIKQRCLDGGLPPECCEPPDYSEAEACPYRLKRVTAESSYPEQREFNSEEANEIYNGLLEALKAGTVSMSDYGGYNDKDPSKFVENLYDQLYDKPNEVYKQTISEDCSELDPVSEYCRRAGGLDYINNCKDKSAVFDAEATAKKACTDPALAKYQSTIEEMGAARDFAKQELQRIFAEKQEADAAESQKAMVAAQKKVDEEAQKKVDEEAQKKVDEERAYALVESAKESKPEQESQLQETEKTLSEKFASREKQAVPAEIGKAVDFYGKPIDYEKLKAGLSDSLPVVELQATVKNLKEDQSFSAEIPEGLPLKKMILTPSGPISEATVTMTMVDSSKRQLLKEQGIPEPDPSHHELQYYLKIDTVVNREEVHPFKEAFFEFFVPAPVVITPDYYDRVKILRYIEDNKEWIELPTERDKVKKCEFSFCGYASSPGTSYFAVVVEKETKSFMPSFLRILFFLGLVYGIYFLIKRIKAEKKVSGTKNIMMRIVWGTLIVIALFIAAVFTLGLIGSLMPKDSFRDWSTVFFVLIAGFNFCIYYFMKFKKKETLLGFGPGFWLKSAVVWLIFAALANIYLILS